ncbi:MAG: hypothetical protein IIA67_09980 [Planctomycetes bacterium]|nr:hypothetical protein [Planctomycetota bacterium]
MTKNLTERLFASSKDGYLVFYPHGPFKGYVVADPSYQRVIVAWITGFAVFTLATTLATIAVGAALGFADATTSAIWLLDCLWYLILTRRLTKGLVSLPFGIGFRFYARCTDEKRLWKQVFSGVMMVVMFMWLLLMRPDNLFSAMLCTAMVGFLTVTAAVLLYVRQSGIKSCSASPGVPDVADID